MLAAALCALVLPKNLHAEIEYPPTSRVIHGDQSIDLKFTGATRRQILVVKVYEMAHYMDCQHSAYEAIPLEEIFSSEIPKQIRMQFLRDLPQEKVHAELRKSIIRNSKEEWIQGAGSSVDDFFAAIDRDGKKDDTFVINWMPGGKIVAYYNGELSLEIDNMYFAKMLWSIWFGDKPVVRRDRLVEEILAQP